MREIEFQILWVRHNRDFGREIMSHHTTLDHLIAGDEFPYEAVEIVAKRQYTGLKDINGTKIFEGDIVKWGHVDGYTELTPRMAVVEFTPCITFKTFNLGQHDHNFKLGRFAYEHCVHKAMEVLGNIHQNPELMEQAK